MKISFFCVAACMLLNSCRPAKSVDDIREFIGELPKLAHGDMRTAFNQMNSGLKYQAVAPSSPGTLLATSGSAKVFSNALLASPLNYASAKNEFTITLVFPELKSTDSIKTIVTPLLSGYGKTQFQGRPRLANKWLAFTNKRTQ